MQTAEENKIREILDEFLSSLTAAKNDAVSIKDEATAKSISQNKRLIKMLAACLAVVSLILGWSMYNTYQIRESAHQSCLESNQRTALGKAYQEDLIHALSPDPTKRTPEIQKRVDFLAARREVLYIQRNCH